jgi:hypothetical protein
MVPELRNTAYEQNLNASVATGACASRRDRNYAGSKHPPAEPWALDCEPLKTTMQARVAAGPQTVWRRRKGIQLARGLIWSNLRYS